MKMISIVTPCFNEAENVEELYTRIRKTLEDKGCNYEHIFIDNSSTDETVNILKTIALKDKNVKIIVNSRNFGHIRSPYYGLLQGSGDAVIILASDLQDPPELIPDFIQKWEQGYKVVIGIKTKSEEFGLFYFFRSLYYRILRSLSDVRLIDNYTGFGLYDQRVIEILRDINDPYPYFRGLIADIGFEMAEIAFTQPRRKRGITKNNFYTLYDMAMLGVTNYTKIPLRLATMFGFLSALVSFLIGLIYLVYKLIFWYQFSLGSAPLVIGLFFLGSVQLLFLGIVGEYIGAIYTQVMHRPLVIEKERINF
ncbi:MAG: glycosyltransferase family 2 protein [Anaerolineales bacterium]|nr:glycosyltransferase family 2 protein [Anaerolineales bacterium]